MLSGFPFENEVAKLVAFQVLFDLLRGRTASCEARSHMRQEQPAPSAPRVSVVRKLFTRCTPAVRTLRLGVERTLRLFF